MHYVSVYTMRVLKVNDQVSMFCQNYCVLDNPKSDCIVPLFFVNDYRLRHNFILFISALTHSLDQNRNLDVTKVYTCATESHTAIYTHGLV